MTALLHPKYNTSSALFHQSPQKYSKYRKKVYKLHVILKHATRRISTKIDVLLRFQQMFPRNIAHEGAQLLFVSKERTLFGTIFI